MSEVELRNYENKIPPVPKFHEFECETSLESITLTDKRRQLGIVAELERVLSNLHDLLGDRTAEIERQCVKMVQ
jgi:hypothetical protein